MTTATRTANTVKANPHDRGKLLRKPNDGAAGQQNPIARQDAIPHRHGRFGDAAVGTNSERSKASHAPIPAGGTKVQAPWPRATN